MDFPLVLFFIAEGTPTDDEREAAFKIGQVGFRNAGVIDPTLPAERCDAVAALNKALIPAVYDGKPVVKSTEEAIKIYREKVKAENVAAKQANANPDAVAAAQAGANVTTVVDGVAVAGAGAVAQTTGDAQASKAQAGKGKGWAPNA